MVVDLVRRFYSPKSFVARLCIDEPVLFARHAKALPMALRAFGSGAAALRLVVLLGLIAKV